MNAFVCERCNGTEFATRASAFRRVYGPVTYRVDLGAEVCVRCGAVYRRAADEERALRRMVRELALDGIFHPEALRAMRMQTHFGLTEFALTLQHSADDLARWETVGGAPPTVRLVYGLMALDATGAALAPLAYALLLAEKRVAPFPFPVERTLKLQDDILVFDETARRNRV